LFCFKLKNTRYKIGFSFLFFNSVVFLTHDTGFITAFYGACTVHELGHILAVILTGGTVRSVEFSGIGIKMKATSTAVTAESIFVLLSGPAMNLIIFAFMKMCGMSGVFMWLNLCEGIYNLMPFDFLDGGAVADILITGSIHESICRKIILVFQVIIITAVVFILIKNFI